MYQEEHAASPALRFEPQRKKEWKESFAYACIFLAIVGAVIGFAFLSSSVIALTIIWIVIDQLRRRRPQSLERYCTTESEQELLVHYRMGELTTMSSSVKGILSKRELSPDDIAQALAVLRWLERHMGDLHSSKLQTIVNHEIGLGQTGLYVTVAKRLLIQRGEFDDVFLDDDVLNTISWEVYSYFDRPWWQRFKRLKLLCADNPATKSIVEIHCTLYSMGRSN